VIATLPALNTISSSVLRGLLLALMVFVGACAGAPVQEMSDARQAIRAAEVAGAEKKAGVELAQARELIKAAEEDIRQGDYRQAREHARLSRETAIEARRLAEGPAARNR
jgi:Domain of unknown function (DUF4398)